MARCQGCQGTGQQPWVVCWTATPLPWRYPCLACGGAGVEHCCDRLREEALPTSGTPSGDALRRNSSTTQA